MIVLCPSRGRPDLAAAVLESFDQTKVLPDTTIVMVVDSDDPTLTSYDPDRTLVIEPQPKGMGSALNEGYRRRRWPGTDIYGFVGDDHRFRTVGWDREMTDALSTPGIAFAFDGVRADLPTQWFVSAEIVDTLGWMALPACAHFYLDDAWKELGNATGILRYLPGVLIEHLHYTYGKSSVDDTYKRSMEIWDGGDDRLPYETWRNGQGFRDDLSKVQGVL